MIFLLTERQFEIAAVDLGKLVKVKVTHDGVEVGAGLAAEQDHCEGI